MTRCDTLSWAQLVSTHFDSMYTHQASFSTGSLKEGGGIETWWWKPCKYLWNQSTEDFVLLKLFLHCRGMDFPDLAIIYIGQGMWKELLCFRCSCLWLLLSSSQHVPYVMHFKWEGRESAFREARQKAQTSFTQCRLCRCQVTDIDVFYAIFWKQSGHFPK